MKKGDKVRIKSAEFIYSCSSKCKFLESMRRYCGNIEKVIDVSDNGNILLNNGWYWDPLWLELVKEESELINVTEELVRAAKAYEKAKENLKQLL